MSARVAGGGPGSLDTVKVVLRNPRREVEMTAPATVEVLLRDLDVVAEAVLVICNDALVTRDARLADEDVVEIRPVISGGIGGTA